MRTKVVAVEQSVALAGRGRRIAAITMVALGAVILLTWAIFIATSVLDQGIRTVERSAHGHYLAFHLVDQTLTPVLLVSLAIAVAVIVLLYQTGTQHPKGHPHGQEPTGPGIRAGVTHIAGGETG